MAAANPGYALAQLERALAAHGAGHARARERVAAWARVLEGMASGTLAIGSRTPTAAPAWATLEVLHGGFATGALAAGGELLPDERALAARLGATAHVRQAIAVHYLSDEGREELRGMLATGRFRVDVPEEAALLAVTALVDHGEADGAAAVLDAIAPYLDRLRFHPRPSPVAFVAVSTVHVETVGATHARVAAVTTPLEVRRMNEALTVWAPLLDRAVDLFLEIADGDRPILELPENAREKALALLADHAAARAAHTLCAKPHRPKQNLAILVGALRKLVESGTPGALTPREQGLVRVAVAGHVRAHGGPGSDRRRAHRAAQARVADLPTRGDGARAIAAHLARLPADGSLASLDDVAPIAPAWPSVIAKLQRCIDASVEELVERGVLTSGEAIARVLPQISAHVRALGFADPQIARLYAATDAAFRRRRSLLLLDYQKQVSLEELPWVAAIEHLRTDDGASQSGCRRLFASVAALAIGSFPHAIVPNPLVEELRALAVRGALELPFVDELAADIFMGSFTAKFVRAAALVARRLSGTLYARYFGLPVAEVLEIESALAGAPGPVPAFGALCARMAAVGPDVAWSVGGNGRVIEQQQILTTQNLVPLVDAAGLAADRMPDLAWRAFAWLVQRARTRGRGRIDQLRAAKNVAYAWRQTIAFLSLAPPGSTEAFLSAARAHVASQRGTLGARFAPILAGLEAAQAGDAPGLVLLGWTTGAHPLVDDAQTPAR